MNITPISDLLPRRFVIPPYQRGYRWEAEQIKALLEDFKEFADSNYNKDGVFYCLQPVVVVPEEKDTYIVVDGQQRLTTIFLLLHFLNDRYHRVIGSPVEPFRLSLPGRNAQDTFLRKTTFADPTDTSYLDNIDNFYLRKAYDTIVGWFAEPANSRYLPQISDILLSAASQNPPKAHVAVIWHEITDSDALTSFRNLNFGKIPLNSSEIIKALMLQTDCYSLDGDKEAARKRGAEWERMNMLLAESSLRGIFGDDNLDMLDVVLSFVADNINEANGFGFTRKPDNTFNIDLFNYYVVNHYIALAGKAERSKAASRVWDEIQETVNVISNWQRNRLWYHLIGLYSLLYLHSAKKPEGVPLAVLKNVMQLYRGKDKKQFTEALRRDIGTRIRVAVARDSEGNPYDASRQGLNSPDLNYDDNPKKLVQILTAFNVMTVHDSRDKSLRFPFPLFRRFKVTSLEHIHPQNIRDASRKEYAEWIERRTDDILLLKDGEIRSRALEAASILKTLTADDDSFDKDMADENARIIDEIFGDMAQIKTEELHHIKNLALVDRDTNSALQNYFLDRKRDILLQRDREGKTYMTPATEHIFSKRHSAGNPGNMNFWTKADRDAYLRELQKVYDYFTA